MASTGLDASRRRKQDIITFKVSASLSEALRGIENRSEFIRHAVLAALDSTCPLCRGSGVLTPNQHKHWLGFASDHAVEECEDCRERHLVCSAGRRSKHRTHP